MSVHPMMGVQYPYDHPYWPPQQVTPPYPNYPYQWRPPQYGQPQPNVHNSYQHPFPDQTLRRTTYYSPQQFSHDVPPQAWGSQPQHLSTVQQWPQVPPAWPQNAVMHRQNPRLSEPTSSNRNDLMSTANPKRTAAVTYIPCPYCNHPIETKADTSNKCCRCVKFLCEISLPCTELCLLIDCCRCCYSLTKVREHECPNCHKFVDRRPPKENQ